MQEKEKENEKEENGTRKEQNEQGGERYCSDKISTPLYQVFMFFRWRDSTEVRYPVIPSELSNGMAEKSTRRAKEKLDWEESSLALRVGSSPERCDQKTGHPRR
jgi:hypothetical protein